MEPTAVPVLLALQDRQSLKREFHHDLQKSFIWVLAYAVRQGLLSTRGRNRTERG
jgi:hypothetical protein